MAWGTLTYRCPHLEREITEIWWGGMVPFVPANAYLRDGAQLRDWVPKTIYAKAHCLLHLARWLQENRLSFWDEDVRLGGDAIVSFRESLFKRVYDAPTPDTRSDPPESTIGVDQVRPLKDSTASRIMGEVLELCRYWQQPGERIRGDRVGSKRGRGKLKRPPAFTVKARSRSSRGRESLKPEEVEAIWTHLLRDKRPPRRRPQGITERQWKLQVALWARECMIWALLICTGLRRGEMPAIMLQDVRHHGDAGWWVHLIDPREHSVVDPRRLKISDYGADLKTGSRDMIVWFEDRFDEVYNQWIQWRSFLVAMTGKPDHGMLLVSGRGNNTPVGSPFTYHQSKQFFSNINSTIGPFTGDAGAAPFRLSSHRIRHTLESIMKSNRVQPEARQATLGHRRPETTDLYGTVYRTDLIAARNDIRRRLQGGLNE